MNFLLNAIELNNEGARQIANGQGTAGLSCLTRSIQLFHKHITTSTAATGQEPGEGAAMDVCSNGGSSNSQDIDALLVSSSSFAASLCSTILMEIPDFDQDSQTDYIFNHTVVIPETWGNETRSSSASQFPTAATSMQTESDLQACFATVIFNLALEHHRRAISLDADPSRSRATTKAGKLYSFALQLLQGQYAGSASASSQMSLLVHLAALNNLAQLDMHRGDLESAQQGLVELSRLVQLALSPCEEASDAGYHCMVNEALLRAPQVQGMLMNAFFLKFPRMAAAA